MISNRLKTNLPLTIHISLLFLLLFLPVVRSRYSDMNYPPLNMTVRYIYLGIFLAQFLSFIFLLFHEHRSSNSGISFKNKFVLAAAVAFLLMFIPNIFSIDFKSYMMWARVWSIHHANPYLVSPNTFPADPFLKGLFWMHNPTVYGPFWNLLSGLTTFLGKDSYIVNFVLLKLVIYLSYLGLIWQVSKLADRFFPQRSGLITSFIAFNPYIFVLFIVDGHFDILMIFLFLFSLNMLFKKRLLFSAILFSLSVLVKYVTAMLFPFIFFWLWQTGKTLRERFKRVLTYSFACIVSTIIIYAPFWEGFSIFNIQTKVKTGMGIDSNTLSYALLILVDKLKGLGQIELSHPPVFWFNLFNILFLVLFISILAFFIRSKKEWNDFAISTCIVFAAYYFLEAYQLGAWYLIWVIPFIALSRIRFNLLLGFLVSFACVMSFWKRLSFLLIIAVIIYSIYTITYKAYEYITSRNTNI